MNYEYKVVEERLGSPAEFEAELNRQAVDGWEYINVSTIGPIPGRWIVFRRQKTGVGHGGL